MKRIICAIFSILIFFPIFVLGQTKVSSCKGYPAPDEVYLNDCIEPPCNLVRGTNGTTIIVFTPQKAADTFQTAIKGTFWGISQDHDLGDQGKNGCGYLLNGTCPLTSQQQVTYRIIDAVKSDEMKVKGVKLTTKLLDKKTVLACYEVKVNIVD